MKNKQFTGYVAPSLWDEVHADCENNGFTHCIAVKIGLEHFLKASHDERMVLISKYNEREDK